MAEVVIAFDIYGTLLSLETATHELEQHFRGDAQRARTVAQTWRRYQLEYTWRLNSMGRYLPFDEVTRNALLHALDDTGSSLDEPAIDGVLAAYDRLQPFPDVEEALRKISATARIRPVVFSNGTVDMVRACLSHAPPQLQQQLQLQNMEIISVHPLQQYKPAPAAYSHLREQVAGTGGGGGGGSSSSSSSTAIIWLISANPFDIAGASSAGLNTIWVDRDQNQAGWSDRALPEVKPTATIRRLAECIDIIKGYQ
ncbi:haloacid dehalogenase, type II [Aspergillus brunneoviolaceus CBS 621.78]|uniref:Haloacid dehalogenase, type II n=1 Tax=Aspergillus brunneoviolaceus CBS 621.78 TaxID=1450534 RepID=A0ACD1G860_9EURO|nr:haloacid dehalogenase, type II [Aspergillus brunneoviolaceus CBS 621.78]RAH45462.1 haloacid dehalogenase, type II [Aspergillus brunneoviolaceus CBS 621.78]